MSLGKPQRISAILVLSLVALTIFWAVFSRWFVPGLIQRAYYGQSWPFVNQMIVGQSLHPVGEYLAAWNSFAWVAGFTLVFAGLFLALVVRPEFQDFFWGPDPPSHEHIAPPLQTSRSRLATWPIVGESSADSSSKLGLLLLSGILLCGGVLRFVFLGRKSFFEDELFSLVVARQHLPAFFRTLLSGEANMGLYYFLLHFWSYMGRSEFVVRSLSVLFGVAALPVIFSIGKRLFGERTGALAAFLLAINVFHVAYSQFARSYSLFVFLACLSSWCFLRCVEEPSRKNWARYIVATTLAVYCHFYAALLPVSHWAAFAFLKHRKAPWRRLFASSVAIGFFLLPLALFILKSNGHQLEWVPPFHFRDVLNMFFQFASDTRVLSPLDPGRILAFCIFCVLLIAPAIKSFVRTSPAEMTAEVWRLRFLFAWLLIPIAIAAAISLHKPVFRTNYLILCLPPFLLLASYSLGRIRRSWLATLTIAVIVVTTGRGLALYYDSPGDQDWRATARYVLANSRSGDALVFYPAHLLQLFEYYQGRLGSPLTQPILLESPSPEEFRSFAAALSSRNARVWLIGRQEITEKRSLEWRSFGASLEAEFPFRTDKQFVGTYAVLFSKQHSAVTATADRSNRGGSMMTTELVAAPR
jgi:mannosyltransferase